MKECDYCGEYKKVRLAESMESIIFRLADYNNLFNLQRYGKNICEECDTALEVKDKIQIQKNEKIQKKAQKAWVKERDAILGADE